MSEKRVRIESFTDLVAWREAHRLILEIYQTATTFPKSGLFGLINQMRRCVVSITSNIAEDFGRLSFKEKIQFYSIAKRLNLELQNQLLIARDIGFSRRKSLINSPSNHLLLPHSSLV